VFCPKCGKELPDGSQFCLKCGRPLTADIKPEKKRPAVSVLGIVAIILLILLASMLWVWTRSVGPRIANRPPTVFNPLAPAPVSKTNKLFTGQIIVKAGGSVINTFTVDPAMQNFHVVGRFNASGGLTNDIQAVLTDEDDFQNWINGHQAKTYYSSGLITTGNLDVGALAPGRYVMAFSNKAGLVDRQVFAEIEARWTFQR
jgi:predicted nucleic acid-binding Zn ribbon protein